MLAKPFLPLGGERESAEIARRTRPFIRAVVAMGRAGTGGNATNLVRSMYPGDAETLGLVQRTASTITSTTTSGAPVATNWADLISVLGPGSACGNLFARAIQLSFDSYDGVFVPTITAAPSGVNFIAEGAPIPVRQLSFDGPTLKPRKVALIVALTRQVIEGSNAEALTRAVLAESTSLGLDALLFDTADTDGIKPAGLRYGVNATAATSGGGNEAMIGDLANLAATIAPIAGQNIAFVASPKQAAKIMLRRTMPLAFPVFSSAALADGIVMAVALGALAIAGDGAPHFSVSDQAVLHMDDAPSAFSTPGTPATVSAPLRDLYQTDTVAVKLTMQMDWAMRSANGIAWTQSVTW